MLQLFFSVTISSFTHQVDECDSVVMLFLIVECNNKITNLKKKNLRNFNMIMHFIWFQNVVHFKMSLNFKRI